MQLGCQENTVNSYSTFFFTVYTVYAFFFYPSIYLFIYLFIDVFIYLFIYLFIYIWDIWMKINVETCSFGGTHVWHVLPELQSQVHAQSRAVKNNVSHKSLSSWELFYNNALDPTHTHSQTWRMHIHTFTPREWYERDNVLGRLVGSNCSDGDFLFLMESCPRGELW